MTYKTATSVTDLPHSAIQITSPSIADGRIQQVHAKESHGGENRAPGLTVHGLPESARFLSIVADDPDALKPAGKVWVHWNAFNIPARGERVDIAPGAQLDGDLGATSGGGRGWEGMAPPDGEHTYRFAVFASRDPIQVDLTRPWTIEDFERAYGHKTHRKAMIEGRFG
ncbi:YbhB/YbcL family Raf kinase inhibitor-like protein [Ramlibacter sp. AN1015]|uniref:YbhB/YbcL family Raf kinase inhibitor-like protein n=1 Tax=Ramlibacter sp. AN1015 TaxID=3133428 RepID=UPI0030BC8EC9